MPQIYKAPAPRVYSGFYLCLGIALAVILVLSYSQPKAQAFINIRNTVEGAMEDLFQGPVEVGAADLSSLSKISVRDIVVRDPLDESAVLLEVDELILRYSLVGLVVHMANVERAIQEIVLHEPSLFIKVEDNGQWNLSRLFREVPDNGGKGGSTELVIRVENGSANLLGTNLGIGDIPVGLNGALGIDGPALKLEQTSIELFGSKFQAFGSFCDGVIDLTLKGTQIDLARLTACFPQTKETLVRGNAAMEIRASGTLDDPLFDGKISMGRGSLELPSYANAQYSIDALEAFFRYKDQELEMTKLEIAQGKARFQARGMIDVKGNMRLDMIAQEFDLAQNLRFIESFGIGGQANMAGVLSGTVLQPDFQGELYIANGSLLGQPYDELRGRVAIDLKDVQITTCNIRKGRSMYALAGNVGFSRVPDIDITVQSSAGKAEELLAVLRIPGDLTGRVDGTLEFKGRTNDLVTKGKIYMSNGEFQDQPFDSASAEFIRRGMYIGITQGSIGLGEGTVAFSGATQADGILLLDVHAQNVQADRFLLLEDIADSLEGRLNLTGTASLKGTLAQPWLHLQLATDYGDKLLGNVTATEVDIFMHGRQVAVDHKEAKPSVLRTK